MEHNKDMTANVEGLTLPLLALRGLTVLPGMTIHFDVGRKKSVSALEAAMKDGQVIFLVPQRDMKTDDPGLGDLYKVGCVAVIKQVLKLPGDNIRVLVEGIRRAALEDMVEIADYPLALLQEVQEIPAKPDDLKSEALIRHAQELFDEYASFVSKMAPEVLMTVMSAQNPGKLADYIAMNVMLKLPDKQEILEEFDERKRLIRLLHILEREISILDLERDIHEKVKEQVDKNQRDYYLREQLKTIQNELGDGDSTTQESMEYRDKILKLKLPEESETKLLKEADRLARMSFGSAEATVVRGYLDHCLELPWNKTTKDRLEVKRARAVLDKDHYGLTKVKERIIEYLSVKQLAPDARGQILCLVGPPGVGKTSVGMSIARAMGKKFARISLGGVRDEADIRGHRKTYIGAMPGRIMNALKQAGSRNPVMLLDEVDKLGSDMRGDPASALLEVLDSEQNHAFRDHYIELPFDLQDVTFITTANTTDTIPRPLLDRMEVITLTSYTDREKLEIAKRHLLPKQLKKHGLKKSNLHISDEVLLDIINSYTRESGVRTLERRLAAACRKAAAIIASGDGKALTLTMENLEKHLGPRRHRPDRLPERDEVGVATGLAWTSVGGETLKIEVNACEGTGKLELTGSLGDVMKESIKAAITYIRSRAGELGIDKDFYKNRDIHVHVPEGAIPKDGPSAGITMATAIISELTGAPIRRELAMTGEVTLRGNVLPIGGLNEKTMAALRAGVQTVLVPRDNLPDLEEIDPTVRNALHFVGVSTMDEVVRLAIRMNERRERPQPPLTVPAELLPGQSQPCAPIRQ